MDRWDVMAIGGAALIGAGVWSLAGGAWAAIVWGGMLMAPPVIREMRIALAKRAE